MLRRFSSRLGRLQHVFLAETLAGARRYLEAVLAYVPAGLVIDPFTGSGSTGAAAIRRGLDFAGCELSDHYHALASRRLEAEALGLDGVAAARDRQGTLGMATKPTTEAA